MEKRLGQLQIDNVHLNAARQKLEQENEALKLDLDHARHALQSLENR